MSSSVQERQGLLDEFDRPFDKDSDPFEKVTEQDSSDQGWPRSKIVKTASAFILLLIFATFARALVRSPPPSHPNLSFNGGYIRSNGTHEFKRTVLIVSIDGLRHVWYRVVCLVQSFIMRLSSGPTISTEVSLLTYLILAREGYEQNLWSPSFLWVKLNAYIFPPLIFLTSFFRLWPFREPP